MGVVQSKRRWYNKKNKRVRNGPRDNDARLTTDPQSTEEDVYEDIDNFRQEEQENHSSSGSDFSRDSAFSEETSVGSDRNRSWGTLRTHSYESEPEYADTDRTPRQHGIHDVLVHITIPTEQNDNSCTNLSETSPKAVENDSVESDDDTHTYLSDMSLYSSSGSETSLKKAAKSDALNDVPYMIEAFQPLIERTVNVRDILPHLTFLDAEEFKNTDSPILAMEMLIARLFCSEEPGKWQAFLHALKEEEYEYIVRLLRGDTEEDHSINRYLLKLFTPKIIHRIDPEEFIDHLFEQMVITERDMEEVRCEKERRGPIAASFMLLDKVPRRSSKWFSVFVDVLKKCGMDDIATDLYDPATSQPISESASAATTAQAETKTNRRKRKFWRIRKKTVVHESYITPTYENRKRAPNLPPLPPVPHPKQKNLSQISNASEFPLISTSFQALQTIPSDIPHQYKNMYEPLQHNPILDNLKMKFEKLSREVEVKRQIKMYRAKIQQLEEELTGLNEGRLSAEVDIHQTTDCDAAVNPVTANNRNEEPLKSLVDTVLKEVTQLKQEIAENNKKAQMTQETVAEELAQLRQEIFATRDFITETVQKTLSCSVSTEIKTLDYTYVDTFVDSKVKQFTTGPKPHMPRCINSVVDSGICSEFYLSQHT